MIHGKRNENDLILPNIYNTLEPSIKLSYDSAKYLSEKGNVTF